MRGSVRPCVRLFVYRVDRAGEVQGGVALLDGIATKKTEPRLLDRARLVVVFGSPCERPVSSEVSLIGLFPEHASEELNER